VVVAFKIALHYRAHERKLALQLAATIARYQVQVQADALAKAERAVLLLR
jgi:hypothetical protein